MDDGRCPVLGFGSFFNFSVAGFVDLAEAEQVVERAVVGAFEAGCLAVHHSQRWAVCEHPECVGLFEGFIVGFVFFVELFSFFVHFVIEQLGLELLDTALLPFGVYHFDHEVHFDGVDRLEALNVGVEQGVILVVVIVGEEDGSGGESVGEGIHGRFFAAFLGDGAVGFRAVGTGGIDFALCRHRCSLCCLNVRAGGGGSKGWGAGCY